MSSASDLTVSSDASPALRYFVAIRPAFLSVTFVGCVLGFATSLASGLTLSPLIACVALFFALLAHAGANVLNDYYDALSGCDAINEDRVFPFTGGSRSIQNGLLSVKATGIFGHALLALVIPAGLYLASISASGLLGIGLIGLIVGWAYSAPPFRLQSRGLGEFGITAAWLLIVVGCDYLYRRVFSFAPVASGLSFALLVANVLFINQFPDVKADAQAGKRTVVVRWGTRAARWGYALIAVLAYAWVSIMSLVGVLPVLALISLLPALVSYKAWLGLWRNAEQPALLVVPIKLTILAAILHGLLLALSLGSAGAV